MSARGAPARLALALLAAACGRAPPRSGPSREVRDGQGRAVRLPVRVARIVSLAPSTTETLFAIGAGASVVGVDRYSDYPPEARRLPTVGADIDPSLEAIVALRPDVVFTARSANAHSTTDTLERLGVPVYVSNVATLDDIERDVRGIGEAAGRAEEARRVAAALRARIDAVRARGAGRAPVRALIVVWTRPLIVAGTGSHVGDLLRAAGGDNVAGDDPEPFPAYSVERVVARAPEVIVVGTHADAAPDLAPLLALATVPAVRDRRVVTLDGDLLFRPGPRVADGVEALARLLRGTREGTR